jgi:hypothetical protein
MKQYPRLILVFCAIVIEVAGMAGCSCSKNSKENVIPINLQNAKNVGSISLTVSYDPQVINIIEIKPGEIAGNAILEFNIDQPGKAVIGIIDSNGITGTGSVALLGFNIIDGNGIISINLDSIELYDAANLVDIPLRVSGGSIAAGGSSITPATVTCGD